MKKLILKSIWNFVKFAILITIAEICSIKFFPLYSWLSDFIVNYALEVHLIINALLYLAILSLWAVKRKYIVFEKGNKTQNIISILFIIASVLWAVYIRNFVFAVSWIIFSITFD